MNDHPTSSVPTEPPSHADVVVIGGGVVGCSIAYFLSRKDPGLSIAVVECDPGYTMGSTGRSVGGIRQQFSTKENIEISQFAARFVRDAGELLRVDGDKPDLGFREQGYLFLASRPGVSILMENIAFQQRHGALSEFMDADAIAARFPWIRTEDIAGGGFGAVDEGWLDPYSLLQAFRRKARAEGVNFVTGRVCGLDRNEGRIDAVHLEGGGRIACGIAVNAAGPWAAEVARMAAIDLPVYPRKREVYRFDCREYSPGGPDEGPHGGPLTVDPCGIYFRPEGDGFIGGLSPEGDEGDPDFDVGSEPLEANPDRFEDRIWPRLAHRVPAFEAIKLTGWWAGLYAVNTLDANVILGPHPDCANLIFANGFSGHGLQQSPAVGRAVAELVTTGGFETIDLSRFGWERVLTHTPILEQAVV